MANKAFQKTYTQLEAITKATVSLKATGVSNDELALVDGRLAQVVKTKGDLVHFRHDNPFFDVFQMK